MENILEACDLKVRLKKHRQRITAVDGISFAVKRGKTLGIVGESGSGKSLTCLGTLGLLDPKLWEVSGEISLAGEMLHIQDRGKMAEIRGNKIAMIMQNPMSAFNPVITIGKHFQESVNKPGSVKKTKAEVKKIAVDLLAKMRIRDPEAVLQSYAFQLSGGMLQRIMIALALAVQPDVLIADEPTTALDLTVQHEIIKILKELQEQYGMSIVIVSHDLGVIKHLADDVAVMYGGGFVEKAPAKTILSDPKHPYTKGLFASRPAFSKRRLDMMEGQPPTLEERGEGGMFYPRCGERCPECLGYLPGIRSVSDRHEISCIKYE